MEIRPKPIKMKTQFLPGSGHIDTAIWMHYMDANKNGWRRKLDGNYTRMLRAILKQVLAGNTPQDHQLYGHLPPITKTIQVRRNQTIAGEAEMNS